MPYTLLTLRAMHMGARALGDPSLRVQASIPPGRLPTVSGTISGRVNSVGSQLAVVTDQGYLIEGVRAEWVTVAGVV